MNEIQGNVALFSPEARTAVGRLSVAVISLRGLQYAALFIHHTLILRIYPRVATPREAIYLTLQHPLTYPITLTNITYSDEYRKGHVEPSLAGSRDR